MSTLSSACRSSRVVRIDSLSGFSAAMRYLIRLSSLITYSSRVLGGNFTRTSVQIAVAIQPCCSSSFQGTSYFFGPISEKTSSSRPSSRTSVAVSPSRRRAWISAVTRKTGAGSRWTSS